MPSRKKKSEPNVLYDFGPPPPPRVPCPIVDAHLHLGDVEIVRPMVEVACRYGVTHGVGIGRLAVIPAVREAFGDFFDLAVSLDYQHLDDLARFWADNRTLLLRAHALGVRLVKFWFKPAFTAEHHLTLDDRRMRPIFDLIGDLGLACVTHVADPDAWWRTHYADTAKFGRKGDHFVQLERLLAAHPNIIVQGAHLGGDPEHLDHLSALLDAYPNLVLDISATKWVVRELSRQADAARRFFITYADRLLFGTDLVPRNDPHPLHYASRYWTLRTFLETDGRRPSPIHDPDGGGAVEMHGLDLPDDVLERLYHLNAERVLRIAGGGSPPGESA